MKRLLTFKLSILFFFLQLKDQHDSWLEQVAFRYDELLIQFSDISEKCFMSPAAKLSFENIDPCMFCVYFINNFLIFKLNLTNRNLNDCRNKFRIAKSSTNVLNQFLICFENGWIIGDKNWRLNVVFAARLFIRIVLAVWIKSLRYFVFKWQFWNNSFLAT